MSASFFLSFRRRRFRMQPRREIKDGGDRQSRFASCVAASSAAAASDSDKNGYHMVSEGEETGGERVQK